VTLIAPRRRRGIFATVVAAVLAGACSADRIIPVDPPGDDEIPVADAEPHEERSLRVLDLVTPDGLQQTVHPDFAQMPSWPTPFLLVATPYPYGDASVENPSLYARTGDFDWIPFPGAGNPIARPFAGNLSDPDMVAIPATGELWVYYRQSSYHNSIHLIRTSDGITYSQPVQVLAGDYQSIVSPSVVRRDAGRWRMWSVNAGKEGCSGASTFVEMRQSFDGQAWGKPIRVSLAQPGLYVWHIDVQWIPARNEYWALYNAKVAGSCTTRALYLATSRDGVSWTTYPSPVLTAGIIPEFASIVYRSTFAYSSATDRIRFWFSGARYDGKRYAWTTAFDRRARAEVFATIARPSPSGLARRAVLPQPDLINPP
jgi:hypothetical protein